jgi:cytochrome c oxidase cbb3-type subunit 3
MGKIYGLGALFVVVLMGITWKMVGGDIGKNDYMGLLAVVGAGAIAVIATFVVIKYVRQMQEDTATGTLAEENWDGIGEYKNELPFGWAVIFLILNIWAIWYFLAGWPVNEYSQIGEYNQEVATYNEEFKIAHENMSKEAMVEMGQSIFIVQCSQCHGLAADGMDGKAANLNKRLDAVVVEYAINHGAEQLGGYMMGIMPAGLVSGDEVKEIAQFVSNGLKGETGRAGYELNCASCHGVDGKGMDGMAPNLVEFDAGLVTMVLNNGKKGGIGQMPSFKGMLTPIQTEALASYIISLGK